MAQKPDTITIYSVAAKAQVSIATVSRVLSIPERVSESTRARVLAAIDELGFVPKAEAAARARKGTKRIGVLAPFFTHPSFVQRLRGVAAALAGSSYELAIYNVDTDVRRDGYFASLPITRRLDGLIVMALPFDDAVACRFRDHGLETVLIECSHTAFTSIEIDDQIGGRMAAEYLLARGHRYCGFVGDAEVPGYAVPTSDRRLHGYRQGLSEAGIELAETSIALAPHGLEHARQGTHRLLDSSARLTAIFAPSDTQAMGVLKAARERGLAVPDDLAVIGFDDVEFADYIGLTTVRQPLDESGRVAVEFLMTRLADATRQVQHTRLPLSVVTRDTA